MTQMLMTAVALLNFAVNCVHTLVDPSDSGFELCCTLDSHTPIIVSIILVMWHLIQNPDDDHAAQ